MFLGWSDIVNLYNKQINNKKSNHDNVSIHIHINTTKQHLSNRYEIVGFLLPQILHNIALIVQLQLSVYSFILEVLHIPLFLLQIFLHLWHSKQQEHQIRPQST